MAQTVKVDPEVIRKLGDQLVDKVLPHIQAALALQPAMEACSQGLYTAVHPSFSITYTMACSYAEGEMNAYVEKFAVVKEKLGYCADSWEVCEQLNTVKETG